MLQAYITKLCIKINNFLPLTFKEEHGIDERGFHKEGEQSESELENINIFYNELKNKEYKPRAIIIDIDSDTKNSIQKSPYNQLFKEENRIFGRESTGGTFNNWAIGHYSEGEWLKELIEEAVRREAESSDNLIGFQLCHSVRGGTGGGLGSLILSELREKYPTRVIQTFSVFSSQTELDTYREPYSCILSGSYLAENADIVIAMDNEAIYNICSKSLQLTNPPTYTQCNHLVGAAVSQVTSTIRFPGFPNYDLRDLVNVLTPFPRMHFLVLGVAPYYIYRSTNIYTESVTLRELTQEILSPQNILSSADPNHGKYLAAIAAYRGISHQEEINEQLVNIYKELSPNCIDWIPDNVKYSVSEIPQKACERSASFLGNSTAIQEMFRRVLEKFTFLFRRKAFLHWMTGNGMDEMELTEAESNIGDLISEYADLLSNEEDLDIEYDELG